MTDDNPLISVQGLKVHFRTGRECARAVDGVSFEVRKEETVCLVGESGCGKTVSALSILGLIPIPPGELAGGRILFQGKNLLELDEEDMQKIRGNHIAMVFQEPLTSLNPVFTIGDQIGEAIRIPARKVVRFRAYRSLHELLNGPNAKGVETIAPPEPSATLPMEIPEPDEPRAEQ